jgi:NSS family neurotransmitter:Na+ symporter
VEEYNAKRSRVAISLGVISWVLGLGTVFSFNYWADVTVLGQPTFFDFASFVTDKVMLPLGGMCIALFGGWALPNTVIGSQLGISNGFMSVLWKLLCGVLAPLAVLVVFVSTLLS